MRRIAVIFAMIMVFASAEASASANKPLERLGSGLDKMLGGDKAAPAARSSAALTEEDVGQGVARFVGGLWKVATFWYPESDAGASPTEPEPSAVK